MGRRLQGSPPLDPLVPMERSSRRDRSRESDEDLSSDTGSNTRLRSRRMRDTRSSAADSTSDGAETDASSAGQNADAPQQQLRRRNSTRRTADETTRKSTRNVEERRFIRLGDDEDEDNENDEENDDEENEATVEVEEDPDGRRRSMSNVSNDSSTSSSSLVVDQLTGEQRRARLDQQVAELEQKKKMVEDGTLAEFCRRVAAFKEERNRLLQTAELHRNLQLKNGQDLYQFEVQRAHHLWRNDRKELQEELLTKVDLFMVKLQVEMKALSESRARVLGVGKKPLPKQDAGKACTEKLSVYVTAVKDTKGESTKPAEPQQEKDKVPEPSSTTKGVPVVKRRKMDPLTNTDAVDISKLLAVEVVRLPLDDVSSDIAAIVSDWKETAKSTVELLPNSGNLPFKLERRRLFCGNYIFEDGDEVHILMPLVHEDYTGTVSSITDDAIYIKLASGQKARIFLPHLERRRCVLKPLLRGTPSTGSLHSMGWSEYDTNY